MSIESTVSNKTRYLTCTQWCKEYNWPPAGGLRHLIFNAKYNGFSKVVRRVGRRILLNEEEFLKFIEEKSNNTQSTAK